MSKYKSIKFELESLLSLRLKLKSVRIHDEISDFELWTMKLFLEMTENLVVTAILKTIFK